MLLHLANDFAGSTVYKNLIRELDQLGAVQTIYTPVKDNKSVGKNAIDLDVTESKIIYSHILNRTTDRLFYRKKIKKILNDVERKVDLKQINFIHAHTWYSDGGVGYLLFKKYKIPYLITIRNSDLNVFHKYLIHERGFGREIIKNAVKVILISASYKDRVLDLSVFKKVKKQLAAKLMIIPNGVDPYWIKNATNGKRPALRETIKLLFIGKFATGKNVRQLQEAVKEINRENDKYKIRLDLIGGGGRTHRNVIHCVNLHPGTMVYHGRITDLSTLKHHFESSDIFVMPSTYETFGLVYVEAMLQGLPILYTRGEGIDGFYLEKIGEKVRSNQPSEIKDKILRIINNYADYQIPTEKLIANHNWENIACVYIGIYKAYRINVFI